MVVYLEVVSDSYGPKDCSLPGSSAHGILLEEYWSGLLFPYPECRPENDVELESCKLSFIWGKMRTASQIILKSQYIRFR